LCTLGTKDIEGDQQKIINSCFKDRRLWGGAYSMQKKWVDELARDLIAFGGMPFLIITIARVTTTGKEYYLMQFILGAVIFFILRAVFKADSRAGVGVILVIFTSIFYKQLIFVFFAAIIYVGLVVSLFYLKRKIKDIAKGVLLGGISSVVSYYLVKAIFP